MNHTSSSRISLFSFICTFTLLSNIYAMEEAVIAVQEAFQQKLELARIETAMSCLTQQENSPVYQGMVTGIAPMLDKQGSSGTKLYKIDVKKPDGTLYPCVARFQGSFWTETLEEKSAEATAMLEGGKVTKRPIVWMCKDGKQKYEEYEELGVFPRVLHADPRLGQGLIIMQCLNLGTAKDVNWNDKKTYVELAAFASKMHNTPSKAYHNPNRSWHSILTHKKVSGNGKMGWLHRTAAFIRKAGMPADFLDRSPDSILTRLNAAYNALPIEQRSVLVHGDLHSRNLLPLLDDKGELKEFIAVDVDQISFNTCPYFDLGLLEKLYVPDHMLDVFRNQYWGGKSLERHEYAHFTVMSTVAALFYGFAYGISGAKYLGANFERLRHTKGLHTIAQKFIHDGFKFETEDQFGEFGLSLIVSGLQEMDKPEWNSYIELLNEKKNT